MSYTPVVAIIVVITVVAIIETIEKKENRPNIQHRTLCRLSDTQRKSPHMSPLGRK